MIKKVLVIVLTLISLQAYSQPEHFNTEAFWSRLVYDTTLSNVPIESDTVIIVVSNRKKSSDPLRFMSEQTTKGKLYYFIVSSKKGKWHVNPQPDLKTAIQRLPNLNRDWVIYTEGMGKIFTSEVDRGMNMAAQYNVNIIMLDYPSISTTKGMVGNYLFAVKQSKATYKYFTPTIKTIKELYTSGKMGNKNLSMFFHSMGNNLIKRIVKKNKLKGLNDELWANNIILNAPCVPQSLHRKWLNKIKFTKSIYIHYNPNDYVLGAAHVVSKRKQLGEKIKRPLCKQAHYINFSHLVGDQHSNFLELYKHNHVYSEAKQHYNTLLHGNDIDFENNTIYRKSTYNNIGWDILPAKN